MSEITPIITGYRRIKFARQSQGGSPLIGAYYVNQSDLITPKLSADELKNITLPYTVPPSNQWSNQPSNAQPWYATELATIAQSTTVNNLTVTPVGEMISIYRQFTNLYYGTYQMGVEYVPIYKYQTDKPRNNLQFNPYGIYSLASIDIKLEDTIDSYNYCYLVDRFTFNSPNALTIHGDNTPPYKLDIDNSVKNNKYWDTLLLDVSGDDNKLIKQITPYTKEVKNSEQYLRSFLAFQSFSSSTIPVNFRNYVLTYFITEGLIQRTTKKVRVTMFTTKPSQYQETIKTPNDYWLTKEVTRYVAGLTGFRSDNNQPLFSSKTIDWTYKDFTDHAGTTETLPNFKNSGSYDGTNGENLIIDTFLSNYFYRDDDNQYYIPKLGYNEIYSVIKKSKSYDKYFHVEILQSTVKAPAYPNYIHLLTGYKPLDTRDISPNLTFTSPITGNVKIGFYQLDPSENATSYACIDTIDLSKKQATRLKTINWVEIELNLTKQKPQTINFNGLVLGTLYCSNEQVKSSILSGTLPAGNYYPIAVMMYDTSAINGLFSSWISLWSSAATNIVDPNLPSDWNQLTTLSITNRIAKIVGNPILAAFNNPWNNQSLPSDRFPPSEGAYHPMFSDNEIGIFNLNSPQLIDLYTALDAAKYSRNSLDSTKPRINNLGHYIERLSQLLGYGLTM